jgi:serine/threonine protein kinase
VLHEQALGGAAAQDKLATAQAELAAARKDLRDNRLEMRSQVVHLVSLASRHCPELKEHPDVLAFTGSDGLEASDRRRLADYDEVQPLVTGRNELLRAKYDGADVCLKVFPLQGDMGAYKREFMRVQRLRHPCIVSFSAAFEDNGSMYLEMEYYPHGSLRHWLETSLPDAAQKRRVLRQALLALACVHSQGIVHSDIKGEVRACYCTLCVVLARV